MGASGSQDGRKAANNGDSRVDAGETVLPTDPVNGSQNPSDGVDVLFKKLKDEEQKEGKAKADQDELEKMRDEILKDTEELAVPSETKVAMSTPTTSAKARSTHHRRRSDVKSDGGGKHSRKNSLELPENDMGHGSRSRRSSGSGEMARPGNRHQSMSKSDVSPSRSPQNSTKTPSKSRRRSTDSKEETPKAAKSIVPNLSISGLINADKPKNSLSPTTRDEYDDEEGARSPRPVDPPHMPSPRFPNPVAVTPSGASSSPAIAPQQPPAKPPRKISATEAMMLQMQFDNDAFRQANEGNSGATKASGTTPRTMIVSSHVDAGPGSLRTHTDDEDELEGIVTGSPRRSRLKDEQARRLFGEANELDEMANELGLDEDALTASTEELLAFRVEEEDDDDRRKPFPSPTSAFSGPEIPPLPLDDSELDRAVAVDDD